MSVLYFTSPQKKFKSIDIIHFLPFLIYIIYDYAFVGIANTAIRQKLFSIFNHSDFLVEDIVIVQAIVYAVLSLRRIAKHQKNLKLITAAVHDIDLNWLKQFFYILIIALITWVNDALIFIPFLMNLTAIIYTIALFFLAYYAMKQKTIFNFSKKELVEIETVVEASETNGLNSKTGKDNRLLNQDINLLTEKLHSLMSTEKLYLDNELNLPKLAANLT